VERKVKKRKSAARARRTEKAHARTTRRESPRHVQRRNGVARTGKRERLDEQFMNLGEAERLPGKVSWKI